MRIILQLFLALAVISACAPRPTQQENAISLKVPDQLPMKVVSMNDASTYQSPKKNWQLAGDVYANFNERHHLDVQPGTEIMVNQPTEELQGHLFTNWEHGDLELMVDVMMPKGSNSGIYFQSRYEIQLFDSWGVEEIKHADMGGIYQRWDESRPEGEKGYEGHAPSINASKAPGLWQTLYILFRSPRFDEDGNKIQNARFEWVYLNGVKIHEEVELTGPTRAAAFDDEVVMAPLMIQGDHGPVALRNLRYKKYSDEQLRVQNMTYHVYDYQGNGLPDIDTLELIAEGETDSFNVADLTPQREHFAMEIAGELVVPTEGEYLFQILLDDGGHLYIDNEPVVYNGGELEFEQLGGITKLTEGVHQLRLVFFQVTRRAHATILYEGPEIEKQILASMDLSPRGRELEHLTVMPQVKPEMLRGFVHYANEKRTHVLSVGDPSGVHYSYDLNEGTLISCWKGSFADVTQMWVNRGHEQLLQPLNTTVETTPGVPIAQISEATTLWADEVPSDFVAIGYTINDDERPIFEYKYKGIRIEDALYPNSEGNGLTRNVYVSGTAPQEGYQYRLAKGKKIARLPNGLYQVEGRYYIDLHETSDMDEPLITYQGDDQALIIPILNSSKSSTLSYSIIW